MPVSRDSMYDDQGLEQPVLCAPTDPRGGFGNVPHAFVATGGLGGGPDVVNTADSSTHIGPWNDGDNP